MATSEWTYSSFALYKINCFIIHSHTQTYTRTYILSLILFRGIFQPAFPVCKSMLYAIITNVTHLDNNMNALRVYFHALERWTHSSTLAFAAYVCTVSALLLLWLYTYDEFAFNFNPIQLKAFKSSKCIRRRCYFNHNFYIYTYF